MLEPHIILQLYALLSLSGFADSTAKINNTASFFNRQLELAFAKIMQLVYTARNAITAFDTSGYMQ